MIHRAKLLPSGHAFEVHEQESLLECALRAGLAMNHSCVNGSCGDCRGRIVSGKVRQLRFHDFRFSEADKSAGWVLLCSITAASDLTIEAGEVQCPDELPIQRLRARVTEVEQLREDIACLQLRVQRGRVLRFFSGQHATLHVNGCPPRELPIASCPCDGLNLRFHLRRESGDPFADHVFQRMRKLDNLEIEGPVGRFVFREQSARPVIFVAWDTDFAPVESLIEHAINIDFSHGVSLYWYAPRPEAHYLDNLCRSWVDALDDFRYLPLAPSAGGNADGTLDEWTLAHAGEQVCADHDDLTGHDVYLAGPAEFRAAVRGRLVAAGADPARVYADDRS